MKISRITPIHPLPTRLPQSRCNWPDKSGAELRAIDAAKMEIPRGSHFMRLSVQTSVSSDMPTITMRALSDPDSEIILQDAADTESGRLFAWTMLGLFSIFFMGCALLGFIDLCRWIVVAL